MYIYIHACIAHVVYLLRVQSNIRHTPRELNLSTPQNSRYLYTDLAWHVCTIPSSTFATTASTAPTLHVCTHTARLERSVDIPYVRMHTRAMVHSRPYPDERRSELSPTTHVERIEGLNQTVNFQNRRTLKPATYRSRQEDPHQGATEKRTTKTRLTEENKDESQLAGVHNPLHVVLDFIA